MSAVRHEQEQARAGSSRQQQATARTSILDGQDPDALLCETFVDCGHHPLTVIVAQRQPRKILKLVGVAVVVLYHLLTRSKLTLDARRVGELHPRSGLTRRRVLDLRVGWVSDPLGRDCTQQLGLRLRRLLNVDRVEVIAGLSERRVTALTHVDQLLEASSGAYLCTRL